jgi:hypothetical protein
MAIQSTMLTWSLPATWLKTWSTCILMSTRSYIWSTANMGDTRCMAYFCNEEGCVRGDIFVVFYRKTYNKHSLFYDTKFWNKNSPDLIIYTKICDDWHVTRYNIKIYILCCVCITKLLSTVLLYYVCTSKGSFLTSLFLISPSIHHYSDVPHTKVTQAYQNTA